MKKITKNCPAHSVAQPLVGRRGRQKLLGPFALLACCFCFANGCNATDGKDRFIPPEDRAQSALEHALAAWQKGHGLGTVQESSPAIHLVDTHHRPTQKLAGFTILGPTTGDAQRCFAVRLTFDSPTEEIRARFVVFGQDPLWVMRYEDYEMIIHWDHPPADNPGRETKSN